jgi:hypothetical protein
MSENPYLAKYREARAMSRRIGAMVSELRVICKSLDDWRKTSQELGEMGGSVLHEEWTPGRLGGLTQLRGLLVEYWGLVCEVHSLWRSLKTEERDGLADPETALERQGG